MNSSVFCLSFQGQNKYYFKICVKLLKPKFLINSETIDNIVSYAPTSQSYFAWNNFRFHHGHPSLPSEIKLQEFIFFHYFRPAVDMNVQARGYEFDTPVQLAIDMGLSPFYQVLNIPVGFTKKQSWEIGQPDFSESNDVLFSGTIFEYAIVHLCHEAVQYMVRVCSDQLSWKADYFLDVVNTAPTVYKSTELYENIDRVTLNLTRCKEHILKLKAPFWGTSQNSEIGQKGKFPASPFSWVQGTTEALGNLPKHYAKKGYFPGIRTHLLPCDLNEQIVNNYGGGSIDGALALLRLGASVNSRGLSWHQGCFDDIFPLLMEAESQLSHNFEETGILTYVNQEAQNAQTLTSDPSTARVGSGDSILFISLFYKNIDLVKVLIELGANTGPDSSYFVDFSHFLFLVFKEHVCHSRKTEEFHNKNFIDTVGLLSYCPAQGINVADEGLRCTRCAQLFDLQNWWNQKKELQA